MVISVAAIGLLQFLGVDFINQSAGASRIASTIGNAAFLAGFDWCVASVHDNFERPAAEQTVRLITAMQNPAVNAIGHLSGRMI